VHVLAPPRAAISSRYAALIQRSLREIELATQFGRTPFVFLTAAIVAVRPQMPCRDTLPML
jgi:hypothetical protein